MGVGSLVGEAADVIFHLAAQPIVGLSYREPVDTFTTNALGTALLLFRAGDATPKAVPLGLIARLEDVERERIENAGGRPLVQYRGKLMPLVPLSGHWDQASAPGSGRPAPRSTPDAAGPSSWTTPVSAVRSVSRERLNGT